MKKILTILLFFASITAFGQAATVQELRSHTFKMKPFSIKGSAKATDLKEISLDSLLKATDNQITVAGLRALTGYTPFISYLITDSGKEGVFKYDASDVSTADNLGTVLVDASGRRWKRVFKGSVDVQWFGAVNDAKLFSVNTTGTTVVATQGVFSSDMIGKKIQVYGAGSSNYSYQTTIVSVTSATQLTVTTAFPTSVSGKPAIIGTASKLAISNAIDYVNNNKIGFIDIEGNYLIGDTDGNLGLQQMLLLKRSNINYNFNGIIYGCVILMDDAGYPQINNCKISNLTVYSLGDLLDATTGNCNWNSCGIAEGSNNTFENIKVFANGGTRGFSMQSDNVNGGIDGVTLSNFEFIGLIDYEKTDGLDISGIGVNTIKNINVNSVRIINAGRGLYCNSITAGEYFYNINISNVTIDNCYKNCFRAFRIKESSFSDFSMKKSGSTIEDAIELNNSTINLKNILLTNSSSLTDFLLSTTDSDNSVLSNIRLENKNISKSPYGVLLFSKNLKINDLYIENVIDGLYTGGLNCNINNFTYKDVTRPYRNNSKDPNLLIENVFEVSDLANAKKHATSGFLAQAYCSFNATAAIGTITPINSENIASITKTAVGMFTITFTYPFKNIPIMSGTTRYYGGLKIPFFSSYPTTSSVVVRIEDIVGTLSDSDYVSLIFY